MTEPRTALRAIAVILAFAGVRADAESGPQTVWVALGPTMTDLIFIEGRDAARLLAERRPPPVEAGSAAERKLLDYCSNGEAQRAAAEKGLISDVLGAIVGLALDKAADRVRAELAKYSSLSEQTGRIDYYRGGPAAGASRLESRYSCLRFTRVATNSSGASDVVLDLVAGIGLDSDRSAILIRPLRLYVSKAAARSVTGHYGVAISMRAEAVWRDSSIGHQSVVFEQTIASESVDLTGKPFISYYATDLSGGIRVPIVPISSDADRSKDYGRADFTVRVAETGVQPATLTFLAQFLPTTTDPRTRLLLEAAAIASQPLSLPLPLP
jgi:hypothetical protein